eukprot:scaffold5639_cov25-Tisochrysis_lutea.AAC.1
MHVPLVDACGVKLRRAGVKGGLYKAELKWGCSTDLTAQRLSGSTRFKIVFSRDPEEGAGRCSSIRLTSTEREQLMMR